MAEGKGTDLVESEGMSEDSVDQYKVARHQLGLILEERCHGIVDANNVRARFEAGLLAACEFEQSDAALVEQAYGVGLKAFIDFETDTARPRRTRPS